MWQFEIVATDGSSPETITTGSCLDIRAWFNDFTLNRMWHFHILEREHNITDYYVKFLAEYRFGGTRKLQEIEVRAVRPKVVSFIEFRRLQA